jgi:hypothetical protein
MENAEVSSREDEGTVSTNGLFEEGDERREVPRESVRDNLSLDFLNLMRSVEFPLEEVDGTDERADGRGSGGQMERVELPGCEPDVSGNITGDDDISGNGGELVAGVVEFKDWRRREERRPRCT